MRVVVIGVVVKNGPVMIKVGAWCRGNWIERLKIYDFNLKPNIHDVVIIDGYLIEDCLRNLIKFKILDLK